MPDREPLTCLPNDGGGAGVRGAAPNGAVTTSGITRPAHPAAPHPRRRRGVRRAWAVALTYSVTAGGRSPERLDDPTARTVETACRDAAAPARGAPAARLTAPDIRAAGGSPRRRGRDLHADDRQAPRAAPEQDDARDRAHGVARRLAAPGHRAQHYANDLRTNGTARCSWSPRQRASSRSPTR